MGEWEVYDPRWLVELAQAQVPAMLWLAEAFSQCRRARKESAAYLHFVDPRNPNMPGSEWQFETNVILVHPEHGELVLDILKGRRVGGIEFINNIEQEF